MLTVSDILLSRDAAGAAVPLVDVIVKVDATPRPLFAMVAGAMRELNDPRVTTVTGPDGAWSIVLPWPSESDSFAGADAIEWTIFLPDGFFWRSKVPEGVAGPLTLHDLVAAHGWKYVGKVPL